MEEDGEDQLDRTQNEEVLKKVEEKRSLMDMIQNKADLVGIVFDDFFHTVYDVKVSIIVIIAKVP